MKRGIFVTILCLLLIGIGGSAVYASSGDFSIESDASIDVPEQTETIQVGAFDGIEITVTEIAVYEQDDEVVFSTTAPDGVTPTVNLYDSDRNLEAEETPEEDGSVSFGDTVPEGGYVAVVSHDDSVQAYLPVIVQNYYVDSLMIDGDPLDGQTVESGTDTDVIVEFASHSSTSSFEDDVEEVNMTIWTEESATSVTIEGSDCDGQTCSLELPDLDPDEYNVQIAIGGEETAEGDPEPLGLSENHQLTINESSSNGDDGSDGGSGNDSSSPPDDTGDDDQTDSTTMGVKRTAPTTILVLMTRVTQTTWPIQMMQTISATQTR